MRLPIHTPDSEVPLMCLDCGHEFVKPLGWLDAHREFGCPADCGAELVVRGNEWRRVRNAAADVRGRWQQVESGTTATLSGIWARTADDAWAVGEDGTIVVTAGASTGLMASLPTATVAAIALPF